MHRRGGASSLQLLVSALLLSGQVFVDDERGVLALTDTGEQVLRQTAPAHVRVVREGLIDLLDRDQPVAVSIALNRARTQLREEMANTGGGYLHPN